MFQLVSLMSQDSSKRLSLQPQSPSRRLSAANTANQLSPRQRRSDSSSDPNRRVHFNNLEESVIQKEINSNPTGLQSPLIESSRTSDSDNTSEVHNSTVIENQASALVPITATTTVPEDLDVTFLRPLPIVQTPKENLNDSIEDRNQNIYDAVELHVRQTVNQQIRKFSETETQQADFTKNLLNSTIRQQRIVIEKKRTETEIQTAATKEVKLIISRKRRRLDVSNISLQSEDIQTFEKFCREDEQLLQQIEESQAKYVALLEQYNLVQQDAAQAEAKLQEYLSLARASEEAVARETKEFYTKAIAQHRAQINAELVKAFAHEYNDKFARIQHEHKDQIAVIQQSLNEHFAKLLQEGIRQEREEFNKQFLASEKVRLELQQQLQQAQEKVAYEYQQLQQAKEEVYSQQQALTDLQTKLEQEVEIKLTNLRQREAELADKQQRLQQNKNQITENSNVELESVLDNSDQFEPILVDTFNQSVDQRPFPPPASNGSSPFKRLLGTFTDRLRNHNGRNKTSAIPEHSIIQIPLGSPSPAITSAHKLAAPNKGPLYPTLPTEAEQNRIFLLPPPGAQLAPPPSNNTNNSTVPSQATAQVNMAQAQQIVLVQTEHLRKFDGTTSVTSWFNEFEAFCDTNGFDEDKRIKVLPSYLTDSAKQCFNIHKKRTRGYNVTYDYIKQFFLSSFKSKTSPEEHNRQLLQRKLRQNESYETYFWDILTLCDLVNPNMADEEIVRHLLKGLPYEIGQAIYSAALQTPDDVYNRLIERARYHSMMGKDAQGALATEIGNVLVNKIRQLSLRDGQVNSFQPSSRNRGQFRGNFRPTRSFQGNRGRGNFRGRGQSNYRNNYNQNYQTPQYNNNSRGYQSNYRSNNYNRGYRGNNQTRNWNNQGYRPNYNNNYNHNYNNQTNYNNRGNRGNARGNQRGQPSRGRGYNQNVYQTTAASANTEEFEPGPTVSFAQENY